MRPSLVGVSCFLLTMAAFAQSDRGTITGTVSDPADAVVPNATVVAKNTETGAQYQTVTTPTGNYSVPQLPAGSYDLNVEAGGFNKFVQKGIRIYVAQTARIDVILQVGSVTESVTVSSDAPLLKTENAVQSTTIAREKLDALPLNFGARGNIASANIRNPLTFVTLVPGGNILLYSSIKLNGAPLDTFSVRVEGQESNNQRLTIRQDQVQPSVESLEEVSVQTSNFAAEYGQVAGGMFNLTVRSGTNQFHGSAFEYFVNEALGAGIPFTNDGKGHLVRPRNRRHNYGFSAGGPIILPKVYNGRNRTFFFASLEVFRQNQSKSGLLQTLPSDAMRNGDFSAALTGRTLSTDPLGRPIQENVIYDPLTSQVVNGQRVREPFPGNVIPQARLDPVALRIQALIPKATRAGIINNWDQSFAAATDDLIPSVKIDHNFTNLGKVSFYYSRYWDAHYNFADGLPVPLTQIRYLPTRSDTYRLNYDHPVTARLLIHAGVGYLRHVNSIRDFEGEDYDVVANIGLRGALNGKGFPFISGLFAATGGGMSLAFGGSGYSPILTNKPTAVLNATLVRNNHTYKAGADWRIDGLTSGSGGGVSGRYTFNASQTGLPSTQGQALGGGSVGLPYASFLLGLVNTANIANPTDPQSRKPSWSLFVQDNWKLTRKLTLDYGLRWDQQGYPVEIHRRAAMFAPTVSNPSAGGLPGATIYEGNGPGRCNCRFAETYRYAIGPRFGVAYQITPKTVLRAGWGITYGQTAAGQADVPSTLGVGGWNMINFETPTFGDSALFLRNGLSYSLSDLYRESFDPGIRPSRGLIDTPPGLVDRNAGRPPRMIQWSIGFQREITRNLVAEAAYVGNRGAWFPASNLIDPNALAPERIRSFGLDINNAGDRTLLNSRLDSAAAQQRGFRAPYPGYSLGNTVAQSLRPFPQFGNIGVVGAPLGNTWYDSLQVKVTKRYSHGLDLVGTFTWQKELTTIGPPSILLAATPANDVFNRRNQKTISSLSEPFILMAAFNYQVPALGPNRWIRLAVGGWTFGGILRYASGLPILVPLAQNQLGSLLFRGTFANRVPGEPLFLKDLNCHCIDPSKDFVLNPNSWSDPGPGQWGTSAAYYNDYRYARRPDEQLSLGRIFRVKEGMTLQIRAEFFNSFNRTYMNNPTFNNAQETQRQNAQGAPVAGFGRIDAGSVFSSPRNGQIVARFKW